MALRELLAHFGFSFDHADLKKGHNEIEKLKELTEKTVEFIAEAFAFHEIKEFVAQTIESAASLAEQAEQIGVNVEELQLLRQAAAETGGSTEGLTSSLRILAVHAQNAKDKGGEAAKVFEELGIKAEDLKGRSLEDLFVEVGNAVAGIQDPTKRAAKAVELFGRGGLQSMGMFGKGVGEAEALLKELEESGGGFTEDFTEKAKAAGDAGKRLEFVWTRVKNNALLALIPIITFVINKITKFTSEINNLTKGTNFWKAALIALGAVATAIAIRMLATWLPVIAPFLAWAAAIAVVVLVLDDLITLFNGGDSVIGRFIDKMYGVGASKKFVEDVKKKFEEFKTAISEATTFVKEHSGYIAAAVGLYVDYKIAVGLLTAAKWAYNAVLAIVKAAQVAYTAAVEGTQVVMALLSGETWAAAAAAAGLDAGLAPLLLTLGAVAAAVGALVVLYQQLKSLSAETEGLGFTGTVSQMVKQGTLDPFKAVDTYQNQQARMRAGAGAGGVASNTMNGGQTNITINAPGQDPQAIARHAATQVGATQRQERRAALAALDHR